MRRISERAARAAGAPQLAGDKKKTAREAGGHDGPIDDMAHAPNPKSMPP